MFEEFKLPIQLEKQTKIQILDDTIVKDLEMLETHDSSNQPIYEICFQPQSLFGKSTLYKWSKQTSSNKKFLQQFQIFVKKNKFTCNPQDFSTLYETLKNIKNDNGFNGKYEYIDWEKLSFLNNNEHFLQGLSLYNLSSPAFTILLPLVSLIIPFFILKTMNRKLSFSSYFIVLRHQLRKHPIGKIFTNFSSVSNQQKMYYVTMLFFYGLNVYQNILSCIKYYKNFTTIHSICHDCENFLHTVKDECERIVERCQSDKILNNFTVYLEGYITKINNYIMRFDAIKPYSLGNLLSIGKKMKLFYDIKHCNVFQEITNFSFGFLGFVDQIQGLQIHLQNKQIHNCKFTNHSKEQKFTNFYYPSLMEKNPITNTIECNKNYLISGPNASGKTTLLKSLLVNQILSQQIGCGFYQKAKVSLYHHFYIYLNIPDTSGRDSLFQAEARRCKNIIDTIEKHSNEKHFCIFDELYSGTNPREAVGSALAYLKFLNKRDNVVYFITTHFLEICQNLEKDPTNKNISLHSYYKDNKIHNTYKIKSEISNITTGYEVLKQLNYPNEILNSISFNTI